MILNERMEDYFNNKETGTVSRMKSAQDAYEDLNNQVNNPYNPNNSSILDLSVKNDSGSDVAKLTGIIDVTNGQFVIKRISFDNGVDDKVALVKRLLNSVIVNLETSHIEISTIYWRVNKSDTECLKACLDSGFEIQDTNTYSFELTYYLMGSPVRKSFNTIKVHDLYMRNIGE